MQEFLTLQKTKAESEHSWTLDVSTLDDSCDLSVKNPNKVEIVDERTPEEIYQSLAALHAESATLLNSIINIINQNQSENSEYSEYSE
jgi:type I restriction enzyme M protein